MIVPVINADHSPVQPSSSKGVQHVQRALLGSWVKPTAKRITGGSAMAIPWWFHQAPVYNNEEQIINPAMPSLTAPNIQGTFLIDIAHDVEIVHAHFGCIQTGKHIAVIADRLKFFNCRDVKTCGACC